MDLTPDTPECWAEGVAGSASRVTLTEVAATAWGRWIEPGGMVIDATAGNGHDTCHLARLVGPSGHVFAVDIQSAALRQTESRLVELGLLERVTLIHGDHARLLEWLPSEVVGRISLACFNLGYLPGGDHTLRTEPESTLKALRAAAKTLSPGGCLSVMTYRGHPGAMEEHEAVDHFFTSSDGGWRVHARQSTGQRRPGPVWRLASR